MSYSINACEACHKKLSSDQSSFDDLNNCCYETVAAFAGSDTVNNIRDVANCVQCMKQKVKAMGKDGCEFHPAPPVIWDQVPHYLPQMLNAGIPPAVALQKCKSECSQTRYPLSCAENCEIDFSAIDHWEATPPPSEKVEIFSLIFIGIVSAIVLFWLCVLVTGNKKLNL